MRRRALILLLLALTLLAAGCGGDDEGSGDNETVAVTDTAGTDATETETETDEVDTEALGGLVDADCAELVQASAAFNSALATAGSSGELENAAEAFDEFADRVPDEIRDDYGVLADAFTKYVEALQGIGLEAGETPTQEQAQQLAQAFASIDQQAVSEASERISAWATANCPGG